MKKKLSILILLLLSFVLITGCDPKDDDDDKSEYLVSISLNELEEKVANKESFILVITQKDCSHCATYKPVLTEVLEEYKITAYELDEQEFNEEERGRLQAIANVAGTPNTIFIIDGIERSTTDRLVGAASRKNIISRFKAMGYIKE